MTRIIELPWDILSGVANRLDVREYTCFSNTSQKFQRDLSDEGTARSCVNVR
jgi:hypothetical protein